MHTDTRSGIITVDGDIITIDFDTMQGMTAEKKLQRMIRAGHYKWVNDSITADRFPVVDIGTKRFSTRLFDFGRCVSSDDAVATMKAENFAPATHVHGLAYGAAFPDEQRKDPIACLGSSAWVHLGFAVAYLCGGKAERYVLLHWGWGRDWRVFWRFLGVQETSVA